MTTSGKKLSSADVCARYSIHRRTLGLWMASGDMGFPKPLNIRGRLYFDEGEVIEYERQAVARGPHGRYYGDKSKVA